MDPARPSGHPRTETSRCGELVHIDVKKVAYSDFAGTENAVNCGAFLSSAPCVGPLVEQGAVESLLTIPGA